MMTMILMLKISIKNNTQKEIRKPMEKIFEIHPIRPISGVLPNNKRISDVMRLPLSRAEFLRCMNAATLYACVNDSKIIITSADYDAALKLFDDAVKYQKRESEKANATVLATGNSTAAHNTVTLTDAVKISDTVKIKTTESELPAKEEMNKAVETTEYVKDDIIPTSVMPLNNEDNTVPVTHVDNKNATVAETKEETKEKDSNANHATTETKPQTQVRNLSNNKKNKNRR